MEKVLFYVAAALIAVMVLTLWVNIIVAITKKGCCVGQVPGAGVGNDCSHCLYIDYRSSICTVF